MDLPFIVLLFLTFVIFFLSFFLFFYARRLTETYFKKIPIKSVQKIRILRFSSLLGLIICMSLATFSLPRTVYGKHLLGWYYFSEYLRNGTNSNASKAFRLWQQADDKQSFSQAFSQVPQDSGLLKEFLRRSTPLYIKKENQNPSIDYLESLEKKATHPVAVSAITYELGAALITVDPERASRYFHRVLDLKSDPESMDHARGNLHELENLNIGQEVPNFHLTTTENEIIERSHLLGKVVLLQFWSRNCPNCVHEFPTLKRIHGLFRSEDFVMIGISLENDPETLQFIRKNNLPLPQVTINSTASPEIMEGFNIQFIPTNYILNRDGKIAFKKLRGENLEKALRHLLAE
jgi:peroxiredoxin